MDENDCGDLTRRPEKDHLGNSEARLKDQISNLFCETPHRTEKRRYYVPVNGMIFQAREYGRPVLKPDDQLYRLYLQVDFSDIPEAVVMLTQRGIGLAQRRKGLTFKWLLGVIEPNGNLAIGNYDSLDDGCPRIVIYFDIADDRRDFFRELWHGYKEKLRGFSENRTGKPRRPGTSVYYDPETGKELRAVLRTEGKGYSEDTLESHGGQWREHVKGKPTEPGLDKAAL